MQKLTYEDALKVAKATQYKVCIYDKLCSNCEIIVQQAAIELIKMRDEEIEAERIALIKLEKDEKEQDKMFNLETIAEKIKTTVKYYYALSSKHGNVSLDSLSGRAYEVAIFANKEERDIWIDNQECYARKANKAEVKLLVSYII